MKQTDKNAFTGTGKRTKTVLGIMLMGLFTVVGCDKYKPIQEGDVTTMNYTLEGSGCGWIFTNMKEDSIYIINSQAELLTFVSCSTPPEVDFMQYSLLLVHGSINNYAVSNIDKRLQYFLKNGHILDVEISLEDTAVKSEWYIALLTPKLKENIVILNLAYTPPIVFTLEQNIPNPAQNGTLIKYTIPVAGEVIFNVHNVIGQLLHTQIFQSIAGKHCIELNTDTFPAGVYFYSIEYQGQRLTKRISVMN